MKGPGVSEKNFFGGKVSVTGSVTSVKTFPRVWFHPVGGGWVRKKILSEGSGKKVFGREGHRDMGGSGKKFLGGKVSGSRFVRETSPTKVRVSEGVLQVFT